MSTIEEGKEKEEGKEDIHIGKKTRQKFCKPTIQEVSDYCQERKNQIVAADFIDYYEARGWAFKAGQPMKDWRAAIRTWERNASRSLATSARQRTLPVGKGQVHPDEGDQF